MGSHYIINGAYKQEFIFLYFGSCVCDKCTVSHFSEYTVGKYCVCDKCDRIWEKRHNRRFSQIDSFFLPVKVSLYIAMV